MRAAWRQRAWAALRLVAVVVFVTAFARLYPAWNFDCIGYSAAAWHRLGAKGSELHVRAYGELASVAPDDARAALIAGSAYRRTLSSQAPALAAQVPFYENKPIYIEFMALAARWGANTYVAAFFIAAFSGGLLIALFLAEVSRVTNGYAAAILACCVGLSLPFRAVVTLATPDALFAVLAFACAALVLRGGNGYFVALLAITCAMTRPDGMPFVLALLAFRVVESKKWLSFAATACASVAAASFAITRGYPWRVLIHHTFVRRLVDPSDAQSVRFDVGDYVRILQAGLGGEYTPDLTFAPLVLAITVVVVVVSRKDPYPRRRSLLLLLLLIWATLVVHFLAFPMLADRFFVAQYLTCIAVCVELLRHRMSKLTLGRRAAGA